MVKVSPRGGVQASSYVLLLAVEATTLVSVSVVESTVAPEEFLMTTSAPVMSAEPNGSLTVKRTNAGCPAGVVVSGAPKGKGAAKTARESTEMPVAVATSNFDGKVLLSYRTLKE